MLEEVGGLGAEGGGWRLRMNMRNAKAVFSPL